MSSRLRHVALIVLTACMFFGCTQQIGADNKIGARLMRQIELKRVYLLSHDVALLKQIEEEGLSTDNVSTQRIILYLHDEMDAKDESILKQQGMKIVIDSWIPALGENEYGSLIAEIPIDRIEEIVTNDFIVKVDTAEGKLLSGCNIIPR